MVALKEKIPSLHSLELRPKNFTAKNFTVVVVHVEIPIHAK